MHRHSYCTYFDSYFLARGLAMLRSLRQADPGCEIHVLALDDFCARVIRDLFGSAIHVLEVETLLAANPDIRALREQRSPWEFYATMKPALALFVLRGEAAPPSLIHIDADTWFFSNPKPAHEEIGHASLALSPHRFNEHTRHLEVYGIYNAGFIFWRADETGLRCIEEWRKQCMTWCRESTESDGRFMNQGYLNRWPERYPGVHILSHPGVNLAGWNIEGHVVSQVDDRIFVDSQPLIFYHFSGFVRSPDGSWYSTYWHPDRQRKLVFSVIYRPYFAAIEETSRELQAAYGIAGMGSVRQGFGSHGLKLDLGRKDPSEREPCPQVPPS
jgi:Nucleotide-diphospho-sugar transferase